MPFDIVDHVCDFPYLVLAALFPLLLLTTAEIYLCCDNHAIRQLARQRKWQEVLVNSFERETHTVRYTRFKQMVCSGTPPPYRIQKLTLYLDREWQPNVAGWTEYLEKNAVTVSAVVYTDATTFARSQLPAMRRLSNLRSLVFTTGFYGNGAANLLTHATPLSPASALLPDQHESSPMELYPGIVLPESVTELLVCCLLLPTGPLPPIPAKLRMLTLWDVHVLDFSPFVHLLPAGLVMLHIDRLKQRNFHSKPRPCIVLQQAARLLPPLLQKHNLSVAEGKVKDAAYIHQDPSDGSWCLVLDAETEYASYCPPQGIRRLEVRDELVAPPNDYLTHLLPQLPDLELLLIVWLHVRRARVLAAQVPRLEELRVEHGLGVSKCDWTFATNVTRLTMRQCLLRDIPPAIYHCVKLEELDLSNNNLYVNGVDFSALAPSLKRLNCGWNLGSAPKPTKKQRTAGGAIPTSPPPTSFLSLVRLEHLDLHRCKLKALEDIRFSDSLKSLDLSENTFSRANLEAVQFPQSLKVLRLSGTGIRKPWRLAIPAAVEELDLLFNSLVLPPPTYAYPPALGVFNLGWCSIKDLTKFPLPRSLRTVVLERNEFPVPKAYAWPPACTITLSKRDSISVGKLREKFPETEFEIKD